MGAKTKIDWCDSTWNPITGCNHGCPYCYARQIAARFGEKTSNTPHILYEPKIINDRKQPYPFGFAPTFHTYRLEDYAKKEGRNIFVCSMADLFGEWVNDDWIEEVFNACKEAPQHNYLFLTKNPQRYIMLESERKLPFAENFWFGTSVTMRRDTYAWFANKRFQRFLSIEPILEDVGMIDLNWVKPEWVIIGAETGRRKEKVIPKRWWIENIVNQCRKYDIPVFMKSNLRDVWGTEILREFPNGLKGSRGLDGK